MMADHSVHLREGDRPQELMVARQRASPRGRQNAFLLVRTSLLYAVFYCQGMSLGMVGPAILDLQRWTHTDIKVMSTIFTWRYLGTLFGAFLSGLLFDILNHDLLLAIALAVQGALTFALPCWRNFVPMAVNIFGVGLSGASLSVGTTFAVISLWKHKSGTFLQGLHLFVMIGATVGPLVDMPFLSTVWTNGTSLNAPTINGSGYTNSSSIKERRTESRIQYAFWITASVTIVTGLAEAVVFLIDGCHWRRLQRTPEPPPEECQLNLVPSPQQMTKWKTTTFMALTFFVSFCYGFLEDGYGMMIFTFLVKYMGWSQNRAAILATVFWAAQAGGRAAGVLISKVIKAHHMLLMNMVCLVTSVSVLTPAMHTHYLVVWGCTVLFALGLSSTIASTISFGNDQVGFKAKETSVIFGGIFVGKMTGPAVIGYLFQEVHPMWFIYLLLVFALVMSCLVIAMITCIRCRPIWCWQEIRKIYITSPQIRQLLLSCSCSTSELF